MKQTSWDLVPGSLGVPLIIAHRGAVEDAPENSLDAFQIAYEKQADGIELDVRLSKDGIAVVLHDRLVDRTTDGRGPAIFPQICGRLRDRAQPYPPDLRTLEERAPSVFPQICGRLRNEHQPHPPRSADA